MSAEEFSYKTLIWGYNAAELQAETSVEFE